MSGPAGAPTKVSLIATVRDAGPFIEEFLASVRTQTRQPDEVIVVDGGSTDGTWEVLQADEGITAISETGANIARGRNLAIKAATHEVIAVSDADCILAPDWLEQILKPLERGADIASGLSRPLSASFLQVCAAAIALPEPDELPSGWLPSARSVAFTRRAFEAGGGYPEWLDVGEDMYLNHRWVEAGMRIERAAEAVVYWRIRPTLAETWRQYSRYAEGDGRAGMYPGRHAIRFATYGGLAVVAATRWKALVALATAAGAAYAARPVSRAWRAFGNEPAKRAAGVVAVPALMAFIDAAKMSGYLRGRMATRGSA
jgi:cellulose synthase/poly-beta-1,6-N-acetylglucosamine synthase-like glycosyltransferase